MPDIKRKLPGRGVWISARFDDVDAAVRQNVFSRGFKRKVQVDGSLALQTADLLRRASLQDLALANKAGLVVSGFTKVEKALKGEVIFSVIHAIDAARDGTDKLDRIALAASRARGGGTSAINGFTSSDLSAALGRDNVNHAAIADGRGGEAFLRSAKRYISYSGSHLTARSKAGTPEQEKA